MNSVVASLTFNPALQQQLGFMSVLASESMLSALAHLHSLRLTLKQIREHGLTEECADIVKHQFEMVKNTSAWFKANEGNLFDFVIDAYCLVTELEATLRKQYKALMA